MIIDASSIIAYPPLLVTSAVLATSDTPYLALLSKRVRMEKILKGLREWCRLIPNTRIVIVDGTNYSYPELKGYENIELLTFCKSTSLILKGKGYGEVLDIEYAMENSRFIREHGSFMKITSKYWIENVEVFMKNACGNYNLLVYPIYSRFLRLLYVNTAFFVARRDFFVAEIIPYLKIHVDDRTHHHDIEHILARAIVLKDIKNPFFFNIPALKGWSGTTNTEVFLEKSPLKILYYSLKLKVGNYTFLITRWIRQFCI